MKRPLLCSFLIVSLLLATTVAAHEARPVFIQIKETAANQFSANWKVPTTVPEIAIPSLVMPGDCLAQSEVVKMEYPDAYLRQQQYRCDNGLSGHEVSLQYPVFNPSLTSLFRVELLNGEIHSHIMKPDESTWRIPDQENFLEVTREYTLLGIQHIFAGIDHLLFIACLVFIARTPRRILVTITGFTLAHSLTLALSTLRIVELPVRPVEAAIALSIIFLAHEIAVNNRDSWTWRYPITVSSSFGLLHGFGFAAVLRAIGLPQTELPVALLFFNVGVEIGQIIFVLALAAIIFSVNRLRIKRLLLHHQAVLTQVVVYCIGTTASYWFVARVMKFWS